MGNENSTRGRCHVEHFRIGYTDNTPVMRADDGGFSPAKANYDLVVEIGVRLESRLHAGV